MSKLGIRFVAAGLFTLTVVGLMVYMLTHGNLTVLHPAGTISDKQFHLIVFTVLLSMVVIVPVYVMTFAIAWRYRASNNHSTYTPEWDSHRLLEIIWWGIPCAIILVMGVITWQTAHSLDPFKPLASKTKPLNVQVVALPWKWLFIYPEQGVASVNYFALPEKTPLNLTITSDAPMNSFWIPALGGQIYAMAGMSTQLHLEADHTGTYAGASANISGEGFADMHFTAQSLTRSQFDAWVKKTAFKSPYLTRDSYDKLAKPGVPKGLPTYQLKEPNLYNEIIVKYMVPSSNQETQ
jgi:cytochrome o ubiquinol oxidase subunit 2